MLHYKTEQYSTNRENKSGYLAGVGRDGGARSASIDSFETLRAVLVGTSPTYHCTLGFAEDVLSTRKERDEMDTRSSLLFFVWKGKESGIY